MAAPRLALQRVNAQRFGAPERQTEAEQFRPDRCQGSIRGGYATYDQDAQTRPGTAILDLRRDLDAELIGAVRPVLETLGDEMGETTTLGVFDGTAVVHLVVCESTQRMWLAARVGEGAHLHTTALGNVVRLSSTTIGWSLSPSPHALPPLTSSSETTLIAACVEVARTRTRGYAVDDSENQEEGAASRCRWSGPTGGSASASARPRRDSRSLESRRLHAA